MKYTQATVRATNQSKDTREIAESINIWAMGAGYAGGFDKAELDASVAQLEREISEVNEYDRQHLTIEIEEVELEE